MKDKDIAETILSRNRDIIRKMTAIIRRATLPVIFTLCVEDYKITKWAYGYGAQPIITTCDDENLISIWFYPDKFISHRDIVNKITAALNEPIA